MERTLVPQNVLAEAHASRSLEGLAATALAELVTRVVAPPATVVFPAGSPSGSPHVPEKARSGSVTYSRVLGEQAE